MIIHETSAAPNTLICSKTKDIFTSAGIYIKTACVVEQDVIYDNSLQFCQNNGMTLFKLTPAPSQAVLFRWADFNLPPAFNYWIDTGVSCNKMIFQPAPPAWTTAADACSKAFFFICEFAR